MSMSLPPGYFNDDSHKYNSPLVDAVYNGDVEALKFMLAEKWDPDIGNYKGITPLMAAMEMADCVMAAMLLNAGRTSMKQNGTTSSPSGMRHKAALNA